MNKKIISLFLSVSLGICNVAFAAEESKEETENIVSSSEADTDEADVFYETESADTENIIYSRNEIYSIDFDNAVNDVITESNDSIMRSWLKSGYERKIAISNKNSSLTYGAVIAPRRMDNKVLKISSPSLSSGVVNNYLGITTAGLNPLYPDSNSISVGENGYAELSFDFYTDFASNIRLAVGRYFCEGSDGKISEVNKQDLLYIRTNGQVDVFSGNAVTLDTEEYKDSWHNIKIKFTSDNKYQVFIDDEAINELTSVSYGSGKYFRGIKDIRLYNIAEAGVASNKYYDNICYTTYTDVTDEYMPPSVSFDGNVGGVVNLEHGESYTVKIKAESVCPDKINVYIDGELKESFLSGSCEYEYTAEEGEHILEAESVDMMGNISERIKLKFIVSEKITIFGEFNGGEQSGEYSGNDERKLMFSASCDDGFEKTVFSVNGREVFTSYETETEFDFSEYGAGELEITAVVYNTLGESKEFCFNAYVSAGMITKLWSEEYESYLTGQNKVSDNIALVQKNGYSEAVTLDTEHGKSLALGIETDLGSDSGNYANFYNPRGYGHIVFETDFYVSDFPADDAYIRFSMVQSETSGNIQNSSFLQIGNTVNKGSSEISYQKGQWYRLSLDIDMEQKLYSIYVDSKPLVENINIKSEKSNFERLDYIRVYGPSKAGVPCFIAFDNTSLSVYESHTISKITNTSGEAVSSSDREIKVYLSSPVNPQSLTPETVTLKGTAGNIKTGKVSYNEEENCIILTLSEVLIPGRTYVINISSQTETSGGNAIGEEMNKPFTVKSDSLVQVENAVCVNGELKLNVTATENKNTYAVVTVWDGEIFKGINIFPMTFSSTEINEELSEVGFTEAGNEIQICIVENMSDFTLLTDDIVTVIAQ